MMDQNLVAPRSNKKEEKLPLKVGQIKSGVGSTWTQFGMNFNIIIGCLIAVTFGITVAVIIECLYGPNQHFKSSGAVVTDSKQCGEIAIQILKSGGSAVDAAVAIVLCCGVTLPHLTSLGGGGYITIRKGGTPISNITINFLDLIPPSTSSKKSFVVPGVLKGLWMAHQMFGRLPWNELVQPSVSLASQGFLVEPSLYRELKDSWSFSSVKELFMINGSLADEGEKVTWPALARTLTLIAENGAEAFYNGSITDQLMETIEAKGDGMLTRRDFSTYLPKIETPTETLYRGYDLLTPSFPSGGPALMLTFQLLEYFDANQTKVDLNVVSDVVETALDSASGVLREQLLSGNISQESFQDLVDSIVKNSSPAEPSNNQSPVGTIALVSDSQDLHIAVVTGLGSFIESEYVQSAGISLSDTRSWQKSGKWHSRMAPVILIKRKHSCQPAIASASVDFRRLVTSISSWMSPETSGESPQLENSSVGIIMRSNNSFRFLIDPVNEGFASNF